MEGQQSRTNTAIFNILGGKCQQAIAGRARATPSPHAITRRRTTLLDPPNIVNQNIRRCPNHQLQLLIDSTSTTPTTTKKPPPIAPPTASSGIYKVCKTTNDKNPLRIRPQPQPSAPSSPPRKPPSTALDAIPARPTHDTPLLLQNRASSLIQPQPPGRHPRSLPLVPLFVTSLPPFTRI